MLVLAAVIDHNLHQSDARREAIEYVGGLMTLFRQASDTTGAKRVERGHRGGPSVLGYEAECAAFTASAFVTSASVRQRDRICSTGVQPMTSDNMRRVFRRMLAREVGTDADAPAIAAAAAACANASPNN